MKAGAAGASLGDPVHAQQCVLLWPNLLGDEASQLGAGWNVLWNVKHQALGMTILHGTKTGDQKCS